MDGLSLGTWVVGGRVVLTIVALEWGSRSMRLWGGEELG